MQLNSVKISFASPRAKFQSIVKRLISLKTVILFFNFCLMFLFLFGLVCVFRFFLVDDLFVVFVFSFMCLFCLFVCWLLLIFFLLIDRFFDFFNF